VIKFPFGTIAGPDRPFYGYLAFFFAMLQPCNPSLAGAWLFGTWLANPIFWRGLFWYVKGRRGRAAVAGLLSLDLALSILLGVWTKKGDAAEWHLNSCKSLCHLSFVFGTGLGH
jgi:hypothetical protein